MVRSHVLLYRPNARLGTARVELWEGKGLGGVRVLLTSPRWEKRSLRFPELSGAGIVVAHGTNEDESRAARMDEWIVWEAEEEAARGMRQPDHFFTVVSSVVNVSETHTARFAHSASLRAEDLLCCGLRQRP